ncbi:hypothetical protein [Nocardia carnea]|uniref:hypothetical protein n=1 Tax=Nocardia carnea TaxID=37328 RepID=UPI002456D261|nr:hypothetical protein [Nocardia carnea]
MTTVRPKLSASRLDARQVDQRPHRRLVSREGRPLDTVVRAAYTLRLLGFIGVVHRGAEADIGESA